MSIKLALVKEIKTVVPQGIKYLRVEGLKESIRTGTRLVSKDITQGIFDVLLTNNLVDKKSIVFNELYWVTYKKLGEIIPKVYPRPMSEDEIQEAMKKESIEIISKAQYSKDTRTVFDA